MAIKNSGQLPAFDLQVLGMHYELAPWRLTFAPSECTFIAHGDEWLVRGQISALRRGVHTPPPINIQTRFPLSLFRSKARARVMGEIVVYPYRPSTPPHWLQERLSEVGVEDSSRARTAALGEFAGNVEYRPGMAVRKWDYRSSARLGRAIVHQFDDAANRQVVIALDTFATPIQLERLLSLAATLVDICAQQQITVGQLHVLQDTETFDSFAATSIHEALETLALVRASSHYVEHFSHKRFEGCMMLLLLPSWDEQRARLIEDLMQENLQCQVMVIVDDDRPQPILPPEVTPVVWKLPPDCEQCL
jgi:uncharacterized protein (DUF58 family)